MENIRYDGPGKFYNELEMLMQSRQGDNREAIARLLRHLRSARASELTPRQEELMRLYFDEGMTMEQIALDQGVAISTVSRTIGRAKHRLYRCLQYAF